MKFKDIRTFQSILNEYGLKPGTPTAVGSQQSGANAKANAVASPTVQKQTPKKDLGSPTTTPGLNVKEPEQEQPQQPKIAKASELEKDFEFADDKGNAVKVVSPVGQGKNKDALIVQNQKSKEFYTIQPDDEIELPMEEGKLGTLIKKSGSGIKFKNKDRAGLKRLVRKNKLREQGEELIFEINFNSKEIAQQALDLPIKCGFEAETSWDNVYGSSDDDEGEWLYDYGWYDIEDFIHDQEGSRSVNRVEESYNEWILEGPALELESDIIDEMVSDREEDEYYLNKYIEDELSEDDIEEYKERILDDLPKEDQEEYEDWDFMNWGRQYVEEELLDDYKDWLREDIRENGEAFDDAIDRARSEYDMDYWANEEYGSWISCLSEHDIYLYDPNRGGEGGGQEEVADYLTDWTDKNSQYQVVQAGEYHSRAGDTTQDYWRVEDDSSIQTDGTGSEIISPVYSTPRKMLEEMKSLFAWLENQDVDTNSSTGLHVTMSLDSEEKEEINPVKLAVLLGDKYLLSTFGRENNSYAKSQYKNLEKLGHKLKANPDAKTIEQIEDILSSGISRDKFSSINFKGDSDIRTGNQLIEFRIGGGNDYHRDFPKVAKAVIRYATTMQSAYSDKLYTRDYATALYRLINNIGKISADDEERVKYRINPDVEAPAVDVLKDYFSKDNYVEHLRYLVAAYNTLAEYHTVKNKTNEDVETDGPDADRLQDLLKKAQRNFAGAIAQAGYDLSQGHNRATPNAKSIGILRSALKDFELDYDKLNSLINGHHTKIDTGNSRSNLTPKQILGRIKNGVDKLFKKSVVQEPEYLTANQVEKMITGMWNAVHSGELQDGQQAIKFAKLLADAANTTTDYAASWLDQVNSGRRGREYKEFHKSVTQGGYSEQAMFTPGSPVDSKKLKAFQDHLKQYPEWEHPVSKDHDPRRSSFDDSYVDNALSKMMIKMRTRWDHLEDIREENPGLYIDSMREIAKLVTNLVDAVKTKDHEMGDKHKDLLGTEHAHHRDGPQYFGMGERTAEQIMDMVKGIEQPNARMVWDDPVAHQLRDSMQNYIRSAYSRYYEMKQRGGDGFYRLGPVPEIIKQRTDAIKEFLSGFDKVAQSHGFDSQSSEIANKKQLDKQQAKFQKKHGPQTFKVHAFDFGGYIFAEKGFAQGLPHLAPEGVARALQQTSNIHRTDYGELLIMPTIHYFTALQASKMLANPDQYKDTWRWEKAQAVLRKFESTYKIKFNDLSEKYIDINDDNQKVKSELQQQNVEFTNKLGDGREGVGKFGPLIPRAELNGPDGEPFEPSSAVTWRINKDNKKAGTASDSQALNDFAKARENFREFDYMMNNGIQQYVKDSEKQDLVAFLNNETQVDRATKVRMLIHMINNVDRDIREPMPISQALVRAKPQSESMNTFDKFDKLPLEEQLRILAKVDKKKIDEAWSKKYKDSINCSNPKGFSQKAHCAGKKKTEAVLGPNPTSTSLPGYIKAINDILQSNSPVLKMGATGAHTFTADPGQSVTSTSDIITGQGKDHSGKDTEQVIAKTLWKGQLKTTTDSPTAKKVVFNRGEVAEAYHALAAFVRFIARPTRDITLEDVVKWIPKLENGVTYDLKVADAENKDLADEFWVTVSLKPEQWTAFKDPNAVLADTPFAKIARDIVDDANSETGRRADVYATNGRYDLVRVIGDGVSGETETKTDIEFENETEKKYRGYSIKVGSVKQIHQVGGGAISGGRKASAEQRFSILQDELFGVHGRFRIADISDAKVAYLKAAQDESVKGRLAAQEIGYKAAVESINNFIKTDDDEKKYVKLLAKAFKFFQARDDDRILLKQFTGTKKGTYILDPKRFDKLHQQGLNLVAVYDEAKENPEMAIIDQDSNKRLVTFRTYKTADGYMRNYIEKGDLWKDLTNIANVKESVREGAVPDNSTVRTLREILSKPLLSGDLKGQMIAYTAVPDPSMIRDFRSARAMAGDQHDLRDVLRSYIKAKLHPDVMRKLK